MLKHTIFSLLAAMALIPAESLSGAQSVPVVKASALDAYSYPNNIPASASVKFMPDGLSYMAVSDDGKRICRYDTKTGAEVEVMLDVTATRDNSIGRVGGFTLSPDGSKIMVYESSEPIYRHSFKAAYYIYERRHRVLKPLSTDHPMQQSPVFSPDGRIVAFVADDNNIYLRKLDYWTEVAVTTDGQVNSVINGVPDWTYQEEFSTLCSMAWSPDNTTLCYIRYDESQVPAYSFPLYRGTCDPKEQYAYYPGAYTYKYPVAGQPNSRVSVHSYDVETRKIKAVALPDSRIEYIPRIDFAGDASRLAITTLNRDQNRMEVYMANPKSTVVKSLYVDESQAWIAPACYERMVFGNDSFVVFSDRSGYSHLYKYSYSGSLVAQLTSGDYDVTDYYGTAPDGTYYYRSTVSGPLNRVVTSVDRKGRHQNITPETGTASMRFSPAMNYCVMQYENVSTPPVYTIATAAGKEVRKLEDNASYKASLPVLPSKEFFTMNSDGYSLNGYMVKPADFTPSRRYPVIMSQYSGPGSQQVLDRWSFDWEAYYASQGYIIICVDGRGTGGRGRAFSDVVYKRLGHFETLDQIAAARYAASLPYVDPARIGIYGWSYGGYEALMAASHPQSPYAAAVAIAPVTDWRYYDTVYAERYMTTPAQNRDGYDRSSPMMLADGMKCRLLIMSGTADDNVHLSNTLEYVSELQSIGTLCDMYLFPNMNHSINGCNARSVVYARMLDFFNRNMPR